MRWKRLAAGPRPLAEPDLVGSPELILEQARRLKNHSPIFGSAAQPVGGSRSTEGLQELPWQTPSSLPIARALAMT
jgi:hypothetical protein